MAITYLNAIQKINIRASFEFPSNKKELPATVTRNTRQSSNLSEIHCYRISVEIKNPMQFEEKNMDFMDKTEPNRVKMAVEYWQSRRQHVDQIT